jgi:DNA primase
MSFIPESFVAELKETSNIVAVITRFFPLKKAGRNFLGICPFHQEKTPSFTVNEEKQIFHCFGCGLGGNVFTFLMHYQRLSFPEAVNELAQMLGVPVPTAALSREQEGENRRQDELRAIHQLAAEFYHRTLLSDKGGQPAREYLLRRKMTREIIEEFNLGYAPAGWDRLTRFLTQKGLPPARLEQSGLVIKKDQGGGYDRFRNRLIFPIWDEKKRVVAFGGRALGDEAPKYLNSPESAIFNKGRTLYALPQALPAMRQARQALIVEGYFDCLTLHQHGFKQAVATLGTALGTQHVRRLKGTAEELILVYDGDQAGRQAALRSVAIFQEEGVSARIKVLPPQSDPDSFLFEVGAERFAEELKQALPMMGFFLEQHLTGVSGEIQDRLRALERVLPTIQSLDAAEQSYYVKRIGEMLGLPETAIYQMLRSKGPANPVVRIAEKMKAEQVKGLEWRVIEALLRIPQAPALLLNQDLQTIMVGPQAGQVFKAITETVAEKGEMDLVWLLERLEDQTLKNQVAALSLQEFLDDRDQESFLQDLLKTLGLRAMRRREKSLLQAIQTQERQGMTPELKALLESKQDLLQQRKRLLLTPPMKN